MIEILQIIFFSLVFSLLLFLPFNIFRQTNFFQNIDIVEKTSLNLVINLNTLLLFSFLPLSIQLIQPFVISIYLLILIFSYRKNFVLILEFLKSFFPLIVIFFFLAVHISTELYLGWDAKYFYYIKSLFFYEEKTIFDLDKFEHSAWHPHFGSYLWGFFWSLSFVDNEYFGRLFPLFLFCYSFFVVSKISKNQLINNIIFLILIFISYEYEFFSGLQEIFIFSSLILISKYFFLITKKNNNEILFLYLILLFSNLLIWIKSEGIVYFFILLLLLLVQNQILIKRKLFLSSLFIIFYILKLIIYDVSGLNNGQKNFYNLEYIFSLDFNIIIYKLSNIFIWFFYYLSNNVFFAIFILIIFYEKLFIKNRNFINLIYYKTLMIYLFFIILFIIFAYIFRDMEIEYAIRTSMDRLIMTSSGFFVYPSIKLLINKFSLR
ncbi:hypothetical protein N9X80_03740 [Candidatus Pelagibacter bacterium]|nr:hypothetical protein [Candidatus Pelagibacter bacterium]